MCRGFVIYQNVYNYRFLAFFAAKKCTINMVKLLEGRTVNTKTAGASEWSGWFSFATSGHRGIDPGTFVLFRGVSAIVISSCDQLELRIQGFFNLVVF